VASDGWEIARDFERQVDRLGTSAQPRGSEPPRPSGVAPRSAVDQTLTTAANIDSWNIVSGGVARAKTPIAFPLLNEVEM
jgi:hypothetical protein